MNIKKLFLPVLCTLTLNTAFADRKGNGGDAVVCFNTAQTKNEVRDILIENLKYPNYKKSPLANVTDDQIENVELLDLYENNLGNLRSFPGISNEEVYKNVSSKLAKKSADWYLIEKYSQEVIDSWNYTSADLTNIDDSNEVIILPEKCILLQLAIHKPVNGNEKIKVIVNERLFNLLSERSKAALKFHEMLYHVYYNKKYDEIKSSISRGSVFSRNQNYERDVREAVAKINSSEVRHIVLEIFREGFEDKTQEEIKTLFEPLFSFNHGALRPSFFQKFELGNNSCKYFSTRTYDYGSELVHCKKDLVLTLGSQKIIVDTNKKVTFSNDPAHERFDKSHFAITFTTKSRIVTNGIAIPVNTLVKVDIEGKEMADVYKSTGKVIRIESDYITDVTNTFKLANTRVRVPADSTLFMVNGFLGGDTHKEEYRSVLSNKQDRDVFTFSSPNIVGGRSIEVNSVEYRGESRVKKSAPVYDTITLTLPTKISGTFNGVVCSGRLYRFTTNGQLLSCDLAKNKRVKLKTCLKGYGVSLNKQGKVISCIVPHRNSVKNHEFNY